MTIRSLIALAAIAGMVVSAAAGVGLLPSPVPVAGAQSDTYPDLAQELPSDVTMAYLGAGIVPALPSPEASLRLERVIVAPGEQRAIVSAVAYEILYIESGELLFTDELGIEGPYGAGMSLFVYPGFVFGYRNGAEEPASLLMVTLPEAEASATADAAAVGTPTAGSPEAPIADVKLTGWESSDEAFLFLAEITFEPGADLPAHVFTGPVGLLVTDGVLNVSGPSNVEGPRTADNPALGFLAWTVNRERNVSDEAATALIVGVAPVGARWYRSVSTAPAAVSGTPGVVPMFRANEERTGAMPGPAPEGNPSLLWDYPADGSVHSAPAVSGGAVFIGDDAGIVHAVDVKTGVELWEQSTNGPVRSGPAVVGQTVYVGSEDGSLYALDVASGEPRWAVETGPGRAASPAVVLGVVYAGGENGTVYAIDANTGSVRWNLPLESPIVGHPAVVDNIVYVGAEDGRVVAIDGNTGQANWTFTALGEVRGPVATGEELVIATTNGVVQAINPDGQELWRYDLDEGSDEAIVSAAPAVYGDAVYVGGENGMVYSIDVKLGQPRWQTAMEAAVRSSPGVVDGLLYVGTDDGNIHALDALNGQPYWTPFPIGGPVLSSPAVVDGLVIVGGDNGRLYAIGGDEGPHAVMPPTIPAAAGAIVQIVEEKGIRLLAAPASSAIERKTLPIGTRVRLLEETRLADGTVWWRVEETDVSNPARGYILETDFVVVEG